MYSQDRKYFRFRYQVIFVAFLLISPTASSAPKQDIASVLPGVVGCAAIVSVFFKDPYGFLRNADKEAILEGCIKSGIQTMPRIWENAKGPIISTGLVVQSGYLLYQSTKLYDRAKDSELILEKYRDDFQLLGVELGIISEYIAKDIEPHWRNGITAKMERNLETVIKKLFSFVDRLNKLAEKMEKDIIQGNDDIAWSKKLPVDSGIACLNSLLSWNPSVIILTCSFGALSGYWSFQSHYSVEETLEQLKLLKKEIMKLREKITIDRANLEVSKMRADIKMKVSRTNTCFTPNSTQYYSRV